MKSLFSILVVNRPRRLGRMNILVALAETVFCAPLTGLGSNRVRKLSSFNLWLSLGKQISAIAK